MYWKNFKTIVKHKYYVMIECFRMGLYWQGIFHDISKFFPDEFFAYARNFFGKSKSKDLTLYQKQINQIITSDFDYAWCKHQKRNPHHWQYWIGDFQYDNDQHYMKILKMPEKYAKEMVCDWVGAGIVYSGKRDVEEWYENNKDKIVLHPITRKYVEKLIEEVK